MSAQCIFVEEVEDSQQTSHSVVSRNSASPPRSPKRRRTEFQTSMDYHRVDSRIICMHDDIADALLAQNDTFKRPLPELEKQRNELQVLAEHVDAEVLRLYEANELVNEAVTDSVEQNDDTFDLQQKIAADMATRKTALQECAAANELREALRLVNLENERLTTAMVGMSEAKAIEIRQARLEAEEKILAAGKEAPCLKSSRLAPDNSRMRDTSFPRY